MASACAAAAETEAPALTALIPCLTCHVASHLNIDRIAIDCEDVRAAALSPSTVTLPPTVDVDRISG